MSWMWSINVLASATQIGVSISMVTADNKAKICYHRDGIIVEVGPEEGPVVAISTALCERIANGTA